MKESDSFEEYVVDVAKMYREYPSLRLGQCYFNALIDYKPELAEKVRGRPSLDPFYQDKNIPAFLEFITNNW